MLKGSLTSIIAASLAFIASAQSSYADTLDVTVENNQASGAIMVEVYDNQASYDAEDGAIAQMMLPASDQPIHFALNDLPTGQYVVRMYQDLNGNKQLDANWIGVPTEPYGFSNNGGAFGPASFADAKVDVTEGQTTPITIVLR